MANDVMEEAELIRLRVELGLAFTPGGPISDIDLLKGRRTEMSQCLSAIGQIGQHVILYGERGVGKTSLASLLDKIWINVARDIGPRILPIRYNCQSHDSFKTIWANVAEIINDTLEKRGEEHPKGQSWQELYADVRGEQATPHSVRRLLDLLDKKVIIVIDEFDQIQDDGTVQEFSNTIKGLSDHLVDATLILVGVADTVDELISDHTSISRNLSEVPMPRMTTLELKDIISDGYNRVALGADDSVVDLMGRLAQGLPHYAHRFGQEAGYSAIQRGSLEVNRGDVEVALRRAVEMTQESVRSAYHRATSSPQKGTLFAKVLLACALAEVDELDFFAAGDIRAWLGRIAKRQYDIPQFVGHLKKFSGPDKGPILETSGRDWKRRYRFISPVMRTYVVLRGIEDGLINESDVGQFEQGNGQAGIRESAQQKKLF